MIDMCLNKSCPSVLICYRAQAKPHKRQSYSSYKVIDGNSRCEHFKEIKQDDGSGKEDIKSV